MNTKIIILIVITILILVALVLALVNYVKMNTMEKIRSDVYQLFLQVEHAYKQGENKAKFNEVIKLARGMLPAWASLFISEEFINTTIQIWFNGIKDLLDDGKINGSKNVGV